MKGLHGGENPAGALPPADQLGDLFADADEVVGYGVPRAGQIHDDLLLDVGGLVGEDEDALRHVDRLFDVVGDEKDRRSEGLPQLDQLVLQIEAQLDVELSRRARPS